MNAYFLRIENFYWHVFKDDFQTVYHYDESKYSIFNLENIAPKEFALLKLHTSKLSVHSKISSEKN